MATRLFSFSDAARFAVAMNRPSTRLVAEARERRAGTRVFLSHSTKDDALVPGAIALFLSHGATVYADDFDKRLPDPPSVQTAEILKGEIKQHPRFVVLATTNSHTSRWIPWELGLSDGYKGVPPSAILPITQEGVIPEWYKSTYVQLYPRIVNIDDAWRVLDPRDNKHWPLRDWLHNNIS